MRKRLTGILLAGIFLLALPFPARAQFIGYTSPQTVQQTLATNVACTGSAQNFPIQNLGQTQHRALIAWAGPLQTSSAVLQGIDAAGNVTVFSDVVNGQTPGSSAVEIRGEGSYPIVRVQVTCSTAGSPTFTLTYEGASSAGVATNGTALFAQIDKTIFSGITAGSSAGSGINTPPYGNSAGQILFQYLGGAGPAGSTLVAKCGTSLSLVNVSALTSYTFVVGTGTALQTFTIPAGPCLQYSVSYNSGGASAATVNAEYLFTPPTIFVAAGISSLTNSGNNDGPILTEKGARWNIVSNPAAGSQASASRAAGNVNTRKVADCVSFSAASTTAPALTALTVNLRDGATGAGTVIWTQQVVISAATGQNVTPFSVCGLNLIGSNQTAMTLEFSAALANLIESVSISGYDVQ
jgi:hypothetical protein